MIQKVSGNHKKERHRESSNWFYNIVPEKAWEWHMNKNNQNTRNSLKKIYILITLYLPLLE